MFGLKKLFRPIAKKSKTEDAYTNVTLFIPTPMEFLEVPYDIRSEAYRELREHSAFPSELIDALESYRYETPVTWVKTADQHAQPVPIIGQVEERGDLDHQQGPEPLDSEALEALPSTAAELMALRLRQSFTELKIAQKGRSSSPVRQDGMLARTTIAEIALDILDSCRVFNFDPGPELVSLFRALLEVDKPKLARTKNYEAKYRAAWILSQIEIGSNELARMVSVNKGTMSDWLKDPDFLAEVEAHKRFIERQKAQGLWPPSISKGSESSPES